MITIGEVSLEPISKKIEEHEVTVTVRRATLADEGRRYKMLFAEGEAAMMTVIAVVEAYLTLVECDIMNADGAPLLSPALDYDGFMAGMTAIWQYDPSLFWAIHEVVREANPHWNPMEGNE